MALLSKFSTKIIAPVIAGISSVVIFAAPAMAAATLSIDPTATLGAGGSSVTLTGTASCSSDYTGVIFLTLIQASGINGNSNTGAGTATVPCDGALHSWSGTVVGGHMGPFKKGSAYASAQITKAGTQWSDLANQTVTIQ
jgi:hypothetical protein